MTGGWYLLQTYSVSCKIGICLAERCFSMKLKSCFVKVALYVYFYFVPLSSSMKSTRRAKRQKQSFSTLV